MPLLALFITFITYLLLYPTCCYSLSVVGLCEVVVLRVDAAQLFAVVSAACV